VHGNFGADTMEGAQNVTSKWSGNSAIIALGVPSFNELYTTVTPPNLTMHAITISNEAAPLKPSIAYQYIEVLIILLIFWIIAILISKNHG
jgi:hypothetical protein